MKKVENNVIIEDGFKSEEESSWIVAVANLGGEIHAFSMEFGDLVENDLSLDFGRAEERDGVRSLETAGWVVARQTAAVEEPYVTISLTPHIDPPIYALDKLINGVINSHMARFRFTTANCSPNLHFELVERVQATYYSDFHQGEFQPWGS